MLSIDMSDFQTKATTPTKTTLNYLGQDSRAKYYSIYRMAEKCRNNNTMQSCCDYQYHDGNEFHSLIQIVYIFRDISNNNANGYLY